MKVLLIGSGGREHALAKALRQDPELEELHAAPGNPGIAEYATLPRLSVTVSSTLNVPAFANVIVFPTILTPESEFTV